MNSSALYCPKIIRLVLFIKHSMKEVTPPVFVSQTSVSINSAFPPVTLSPALTFTADRILSLKGKTQTMFISGNIIEGFGSRQHNSSSLFLMESVTVYLKLIWILLRATKA